MVAFEPHNFNDLSYFVNLVGGGIAIGAVAVVTAGLIGYTLSKIIKVMLGRF